MFSLEFEQTELEKGGEMLILYCTVSISHGPRGTRQEPGEFSSMPADVHFGFGSPPRKFERCCGDDSTPHAIPPLHLSLSSSPPRPLPEPRCLRCGAPGFRWLDLVDASWSYASRTSLDRPLGNPYIRASCDNMPPIGTTEGAQQASNRRRAPSERVVPVIPLGLNKAKLSKPNKRKESEGAERDGNSGEASNSELPVLSTLNGEAQVHGEPIGMEPEKFADIAVRMPTNGAYPSRPRAKMSISIGSTVEAPTTPPPTEQPSLAITPSSSRKPVDKLDMRSIRTELPPLAPTFVPSAEQHTPRSAASSQSNRPPSNLYNPAAHASTNGILFGTQDSLTSSPAPPLSAGSAFVPPSYGNMGPPPNPYYMPHGHSHHVSEPHTQRILQPMYAQHATPWNMRHPYGQPQAPYFHPHGHMGFRYPPRDVFTPAETHQPNGRSSRSRSASQTSSAAADQKTGMALQSPLSPDDAPESAKAIMPEPKAAFHRQSHPRPSPMNYQMPPPPPPQFPPPEVASNMENADALRLHVVTQFNDPNYSDCVLLVTEQATGNEQSFDAHRIVVSRSSSLVSLISTSDSSQSPVQVRVTLSGKYLRIDAFTDALKYLYGGPLLQIDQHRPGSSAGERFPSNVERMEHALRYIATGKSMNLQAVALRGVEVAGGLLHWDTMSTALAFALDGGLSQVWNVEDGSEDRASTASSDDSLGRPETMSTPTYDPYATNLLQRIVDFTVHVFPPNFYLDASAPQLASCPRLPNLPPAHESRQSRSDPRLSQIRFGEIPIEDHQRPSFATTTISSVLLSFPFQLLKCVLEHYDLAARLGPETVASIMRQVVAERETRRTKILNARAASQINDGTDAQLAQNLYWQESVEPSAQHRAGFRLARRKRDIDTPPSSGACSERNK